MEYRYINHDELVQLIRSGQAGKDYQVVDVRDEDFRGGNIKGAIRAPSEQRTDQSVRDLVTHLDGVPKVIFHCTMSQVRGPKAARIYAEAVREHEREQVRRQDRTGSKPASEARASDDSAAAENACAADKARTFSPNPYDSAASSAAAAAAALPPRQEVLVLRDGFQNWQGLYRKDLELVENFDVRIWQEYAP